MPRSVSKDVIDPLINFAVSSSLFAGLLYYFIK